MKTTLERDTTVRCADVVDKAGKERLYLIDGIRGAVIISMILYHACWDAVYLLGFEWKWFDSAFGYIWQQSICMSFIMISGYCINLSERPLRRGIIVFAAGIAVTAVTFLVIPEERIIFGVLTFIGCAMICFSGVKKTADRLESLPMLIISVLLFVFTKPVNYGCIGLMDKGLIELPEQLYHGWAATFLGFTPKEFFSSDYFSFFPWIFLFSAGFFIGRLTVGRVSDKRIMKLKIPFLSTAGRYSLYIYLAHQPVLYLAVLIIEYFRSI